MSGEKSGKSPGNAEAGSKAERRAARLRSALRENLKRRKAQARGRSGPAPAADGETHDSAGIVPDKPRR
jgi:hypothetical protein